MVVRFVFEHHGIFFGLAVELDVDVYRAGVNLLRFVEVVQPAVLFKLFCAYRRNVHEAGIFIRPALIEFVEKVVIEGVRLLHAGIAALYLHVGYLRRESRVAAVVRPVCIDNFELRFGRVALFGSKIVAHENEVFDRHGKAHLFVVYGNLLVAHGGEALNRFDVGRLHVLVHEGCGLFKPYFFALDGIYEVFFKLFDLFRRGALYGVHARALDEGALLLR